MQLIIWKVTARLCCVPLFRLELLLALSLQGAHLPTLSCSTSPTPGRQRAACRTYSLVPLMQLEAVHFKKERPVSFINRLHNYEGIQRTKLKTVRGKMYSLDYIQYIICFLFFVYKCKLCISSFVITIKYMVNITRTELKKVSTHTLQGGKAPIANVRNTI